MNGHFPNMNTILPSGLATDFGVSTRLLEITEFNGGKFD